MEAGLTEQEARVRAEAVLIAAEAAGAPLLDPLGRRLSPVTMPEYRRGRRPANAGRKFPAEVLTPDEMGVLLDALPKGKTGVRDAALIVVLWRAGLRIAEALALELKDVDLAGGAITVLRGKGDKRRVAAIDPIAVRYLERWLAVRGELEIDEPDIPLFCTTRRDGGGIRPMRASAFRQTLARYAKRAGIAKRCHPHGLRHTMAFELAMENVPLPLIRAQLGHVDLTMTARYIDHLAPAALVKALRQREWPEELLPPAPSSPIATMSQSELVPPVDHPRIPLEVASERREPVKAPTRVTTSPNAKTLQRVLDLLAAHGGRATQAQLTRQLAVTKARTGQLLTKLEDEGLIVSGGYHREPGMRGPGSRVWRLAPPKAKLMLATQLHDPRERAGGQIARRGYGPQRVLDVITGFDGHASQAQIARELGIGATTVAHHCRELALEGKITRGGLDKTNSNRGSQVWRIASPKLAAASGGWHKMTFAVPRGTAPSAAVSGWRPSA